MNTWVKILIITLFLPVGLVSTFCQKETNDVAEPDTKDTVLCIDTLHSIDSLILFDTLDFIDKSCYLTKNVIVIIIDGARYSETWGDSSHINIPRLSNNLAAAGIINTQFYNNGPTYTLAGHTSITTGFYQEINNAGDEIPQYPSFIQYWNAKYLKDNQASWIIASKDKLEVLRNCQNAQYKDKYLPSANCGIDGLGSGYRNDSTTLSVVMNIFNEDTPQLAVINFREPDYSAHTGNWENYIRGIKSSDEFAYQIWKYIEENDFYKDKTTLFITNDHGRHLDSISNGFISHGDDCAGCRHLLLYAFGPDFKQGIVCAEKRELIDITATISELLYLNMEYSQGKVMTELFKTKYQLRRIEK